MGWKKEKEEAIQNFKKWFHYIENHKYEDCLYFIDAMGNEILFILNGRYRLWSYRKAEDIGRTMICGNMLVPRQFSISYGLNDLEKKFKKFGIVKVVQDDPKES